MEVIPSKKIVATFVVSIYFFIALFGMSMFIMHTEHGDMMTGGCPLMRDIGSLCQTGIVDHILHWNMLFATILPTIIMFVAAFALFALQARALVISPPHERYRCYSKNHPHIRLFQRIVFLFSSGIIQPKVFA